MDFDVNFLKTNSFQQIVSCQFKNCELPIFSLSNEKKIRIYCLPPFTIRTYCIKVFKNCIKNKIWWLFFNTIRFKSRLEGALKRALPEAPFAPPPRANLMGAPSFTVAPEGGGEGTLDLFSIRPRPRQFLFEKRHVFKNFTKNSIFSRISIENFDLYLFFLQFNTNQCFQKCLVKLLFHFWQCSLKITCPIMETTIKRWIKV